MSSSVSSSEPLTLSRLGLVGDTPSLDELLNYPFQELKLEYQENIKALWCHQLHRLRPNFTVKLIAEIKQLQSMIGSCFSGGDRPFRYLIWASDRPNIFNLGGDLIRFVELINSRDRAGLEDYAFSCVDICFANYMNLDLPITTVALASGDALGGGLESLLSSDIVVVEKSAQFGFPEVLFGLFPGMGAYTFVYRRAGRRVADEMVFSGRFYNGQQLFDMGLAEMVARDGEGRATLRDYLKKMDRRFAARNALFEVRRQTECVTRDEMMNIARNWVETALALDNKDVKRMRLIARAQAAQLKKQGAARQLELSSDKQSAGSNQGNKAARPIERKSNPLEIVRITKAEPAKKPPATGAKSNRARPTITKLPGIALADSGPKRGVYNRILRDTAEARAAAILQPKVERMLSEGLPREEYLEFLEQLYHVVWHFCPTMAAAAAKCGDDLRELRYALYHKIDEEKGHEKWVLDDVAAIGCDADLVANGRPAVPVRAMIGHNYYVSERENPWAVMGMLLVLEEISANYAGRIAQKISLRLGLSGNNGIRFLGSHGELDIGHVDELADLFEQVRDDNDVTAIVEAAQVNYALFGALFRDH